MSVYLLLICVAIIVFMRVFLMTSKVKYSEALVFMIRDKIRYKIATHFYRSASDTYRYVSYCYENNIVLPNTLGEAKLNVFMAFADFKLMIADAIYNDKQ